MNKENSNNINFSVSVDEANKILKALGNLPFIEVYELIGKLNEQANQQLVTQEHGRSFVNGRNLDPNQFLDGE